MFRKGRLRVAVRLYEKGEQIAKTARCRSERMKRRCQREELPIRVLHAQRYPCRAVREPYGMANAH